MIAHYYNREREWGKGVVLTYKEPDLPPGVAVEDQIDNVRCLPGETGVIDICGFLQSLQDIGYDGPITPEPFSKKLQGMSPAQAAATAGQSMRKIWEIAGL